MHVLFVNLCPYLIYILSILHVRFLVFFFTLSIPYLYPIYTPYPFSVFFSSPYLYPIYTLSILHVRFLVFFFSLPIPYPYPIYTPGPFSGIFLHPIYSLSIPYLYYMSVFWYFSSPYLYPIYTPCEVLSAVVPAHSKVLSAICPLCFIFDFCQMQP